LSDMSYTGAAFGIQPAGNTAFSLIGMGLVFCSMLFMASGGLERKIEIHNIIHGSKKLSKIHSKSNQQVEREVAHLVEELRKGNFNPGLGNKHLSGTDTQYARGRNGGRVAFKRRDNGSTIEIYVVGMSDKAHEPSMLDELRKEDNYLNEIIRTKYYKK
ncbi:hypothetical protein J4468_00060, partial [Candidatus Woesearchaeota archaeon]|nr:hypothetical protein [Candidatus Woesearchaeota archaeon]